MSQLNSDTIEKTKQQIRGLIGEIQQLSKSDLSSEEYYSQFLQRVIQALAAVGGAIWVLGRRRILSTPSTWAGPHGEATTTPLSPGRCLARALRCLCLVCAGKRRRRRARSAALWCRARLPPARTCG